MSKFNAALFDELESLFPDTDAESGCASYSVAGCNGMYAGVSIMLNGLTPGIPVAIGVSGPHTAFKLFEMIPLPVEANTGADQRSAYLKNDVNETVIRRAPFYVYDVLKPVYNMIIPGGVSAALVFRTPVEYVREKRESVWHINVSHAGAEKELEFTVEEYPCSVPKAGRDTFRYINWISYSNVAKHHGVSMESPEYRSILESYLRAAVYSRQNTINIPVTAFMKTTGSRITLDTDRLLALIETAKSAGITLFQGSALCGRLSSLGDNDAFYNSLPHDEFTSPEQIVKALRDAAFDAFDNGTYAKELLTGKPIPGEGEAVLAEMCALLNNFIKTNGLEDSWVQCMLDEPNDALSEAYHRIAAVHKAKMPGIKRFEPVLPTHKLDGCVDIWCPTIETYENDREYYDNRCACGDELHVYTCLTPGGNYTNRMLDMQRIRQVYLFWGAAKYENIKGFLHWGLNQYPPAVNPYERSVVMFSEQVLEYHPKLCLFLPAGDYAIFYPGFEQPLVTTRSEAHRLGLEDYELLMNLDGGTRASILGAVFKGFADYDKDISAYRRARKRILEASVNA